MPVTAIPRKQGPITGSFSKRTREMGSRFRGNDDKGRMNTLITILKWSASLSGIVAASMVSLDLGRKITGWGFVVFVGSALCWVAGAVLSHDWALGTQNAVLLGINLFGVYRYLIRKKLDG